MQTVAQVVMSSCPVFVGKHIDAVGIGQIFVHSELPCHHVGDKEYEHQRDAQPRHVDECKELVALQEGEIGFHVVIYYLAIYYLRFLGFL